MAVSGDWAASYRSPMTGSLRKRGPDSWQLRVYLGVDADTGKQRWATTTVRGSKRYANTLLGEFARQAEYSKVRAGTVNDLLDRWVTAAAPKGGAEYATRDDPTHWTRRSSSLTASRRSP